MTALTPTMIKKTRVSKKAMTTCCLLKARPAKGFGDKAANATVRWTILSLAVDSAICEQTSQHVSFCKSLPEQHSGTLFSR